MVRLHSSAIQNQLQLQLLVNANEHGIVRLHTVSYQKVQDKSDIFHYNRGARWIQDAHSQDETTISFPVSTWTVVSCR